MAAERVILIGLSGTGKSSVAPLVASRLGYRAVDIDEEIVRRLGRPIPDIFREAGEPVFRVVERQVLSEVCRDPGVVVATGGGVVLDEANWAVMRPGSVIVHLRATTAEILDRLARAAAKPGDERPLLAGDDPATRLDALWRQRAALYARGDLELDTTGCDPAEIADAIVAAADEREHAGLVPTTSIAVPTGRSDLYVGTALLERAGVLAHRRWPDARVAWVISDDRVMPLWGDRLREPLVAAGFEVRALTVPAGEASKSWEQAGALVGRLIEGRLDRRDIVCALGGGVVGDLAGFVASVSLRGVGLMQLPTSLLAMVDSSVGGKTGVNHPLGKNLIGSFYQPQLVLADPTVLETLPARELRAGWAEIVKHAMIERTATGSAGAYLLAQLEAEADLLTLESQALTALIRHNIQLKAAVVRADEREGGLRRVLNYGHTLGHAMEAAGYRYHHGEAVALGMRAAARIALRLGRCGPDLVSRQDALLDGLGLPGRFEGQWDAVRARLAHDKKAVRGALTWVLPVGPGEVELRRDVPLGEIEAVARGLGAD